MHKYREILILHPIDNSTKFLEPFKESFGVNYYGFNSDTIYDVKAKLGDLEPKSLIVFIGHGSSRGLYEPDERHIYEKYFLDEMWANHYFEDHDVILLCCRSNEFMRKINKASCLIGFGNIISSKRELDVHNENTEIKKNLSEEEIGLFNSYFVNSIIKTIKLLEDGKIAFKDVRKYISFFINKCIVNVLKDKTNCNRVELARLLFEFRDEIKYQNNVELFGI